jgi:carbamoyl-phosphate synthase small subunit
MTAATLLMADGSAFPGRLFGARRPASGEVVFNTGMVGYTEALTDPSYRGQLLCLTYPLVGNYGVPPEFESARIQASALIVSELTHDYSHAAATKSLPQWLADEGIPCLAGIDTRALTKRLRQVGCLPGRIVVGRHDDADGRPLAAAFTPAGEHVVAAVSHAGRVEYPGGRARIVLVDCGAKASILTQLRARDLGVVRVPWNHDFLDEDFDAIVVSNGPGDPADCSATVRLLARAMAREKPILGICLGHQLLALAAGASTYRLKFGHRGHNQPCVESGSQRCFITSQNHGYAVDAATLPSGWHSWFTNANDGSNEGIRHRSRPFMSVQFHPEAAPGPVDCEPIFDRFVEMIG